MPQILSDLIGLKSSPSQSIVLNAVDITDLCPNRKRNESVRIEYVRIAGELMVTIHDCWMNCNHGIASTHRVDPARPDTMENHLRQQADKFGIGIEKLRSVISEFAPSASPESQV